MPADTDAGETSSLRAWCLAVLSEARLQTRLFIPFPYAMHLPVLHTDTDVAHMWTGPDGYRPQLEHRREGAGGC